MPVISSIARPHVAPAISLSLACDTCAVRDRAICATLSQSERAQLNDISHFKDFAPGQQILRQGEAQPFFATVGTGTLKLTKSLADGRQQIVGLQFPSDFLGRPWRSASPYDATAASPVTLCLFSRDKFEALTRTYPSLGHRLLAYTLDDLDAAQDWLLLLGRKTASEKVATLLGVMAKRLAPTANQTSAASKPAFDLPLTRAEMADCLGLTLETVCRRMSSLKSAGLISLHAQGRAVAILDPDGLRRAAGLSES